MPKIKIKPTSTVDVSFGFFSIKQLTISQNNSSAEGLYRIDIVARKYGIVNDTRIYDDKEITFTSYDFMSILPTIMQDIDGYNPSQVENKISDAFNKANKGDTAELFASTLELVGRLLLSSSKIDFDSVEE